MWKEYSVNFIKRNRASSISIAVAALIAALFLSFLCSSFFNIWTYEINSIILQEGDWQGRITENLTQDDLSTIQNFANVQQAVINEELSVDDQIVVDIRFDNARTIFRDMPLIIEKLGLEDDSASYHLLLLSRYLIHDPQDKEPPLLVTFYLFVLLLAALSFILIIHHSFAVSMNARIHQFGIFSSIGATPKQIRICLLQEAAVLCALPILVGVLLGIGLSFGVVQASNVVAKEAIGRPEAVWGTHPLVLIATALVSALTVLISAWLPARKLSKLTPLQAIRNTNELLVTKKKHSYILSWLFGIEGELAGNALKAQKKALRTATLSLTFSFLAFTLMLCFFTLSDISTSYTYFDRYKDKWDVMVTVKDTRIAELDQVEKIRGLTGVQDCTVYQKAAAMCQISLEDVSDELVAIGGLAAVAGSSVTVQDDSYLAQAPIVIMDDEGFAAYCKQIGITPMLDGSIVLNRIWDNVHSNFRYPEYIPYVKEDRNHMTLQSNDPNGHAQNIGVLAYTQIQPILREEYDKYSLVQFVPLSLWEEISAQIGDAEADLYIRILADEGMTLAQLNALESDVSNTLINEYPIESENILQERVTNDNMFTGYMLIIGAFCSLLAIIGIANVFSNTLSFLRQRKREFAQYMSVGMTHQSMRKMFCIEALVIAGRPLLITLPVTVLFVGLMIKASYLNPAEFLMQAPLVPILLFILAVFAFVAWAYYIGGKRVLTCNLVDALKNDSIA